MLKHRVSHEEFTNIVVTTNISTYKYQQISIAIFLTINLIPWNIITNNILFTI